MFCTDIPAPLYLIFSDSVPQLLYYSHIPAAIISLLLGLFVFWGSKKSLQGKLLLIIGITFSLWSFLNIILWTNINSETIMFVGSFLGILDSLLFITCFYFIDVFIDKKDIEFKTKLLLGALILPLIFFISQYVSGFNLSNCEPFGNDLYIYYIIALELFVFFGIIINSILKYRKSEKEFKKQILYVSIGISFFLISFIVARYAADIFNNFELEQYGFFGMTFFMGMLAFSIVKFKAFNIKLLGAQALVVSLVILIASEFFFIPLEDTTNVVLISITVLLAVIFGMWLINSVKKDVQRKEELQHMADKLAQANDELRKLDNAKTEFISVASHQLRTPVTAIKGFTSLILEGSYGEVSEKVHGALERIFISVDRLVNLIEDLLNVSRIESGRITFVFEMSSIEKLLKELYDNFIIVAKNKKLYLDLKELKDQLPEIKIDYQKIRELVSNFIDNALKYTQKGGVTVSAEVRDEGVVIDENGFVIPGQKSPFGKVVRITVSDTGIGIPKEEIPYLFRKFSRGKDVSRLHVEGTGLGLYVGKAIADAHHGQTWVESDGAGMGSRFIIEIPLEHQD